MHTPAKHAFPLLAAGAAALAAGCGGSSTASQPGPAGQHVAASSSRSQPGGPIEVKLSEWSITSSASVAKPGKVTFAVQNAGKVPHELVVLRTDKQPGQLGSGARIPEKGDVGETDDVPAGASKRLTVKLPKGHYVLVCNMAGHYSSGMHASFRVV